MPASVFLQENVEKYLVPSSNAPLSNTSNSNGPFYMEMGFSLTVAGGAYLGNYPAGQNLPFLLKWQRMTSTTI
jgi:hypothetical protein